MKILEVGSLNVRHGGPPFSISRQMIGLSELGEECVCVMPPCDENNIIDKSLNYRFIKGNQYRLFGLRYNSGAIESFRQLNDFELYHIQGIWSYISHISAKYARKHHIPYVISPRGALYRYARQIRWFKKKIAWLAYEREDVFNANCIQATCVDEMLQIRELGYKNPIAIIPNSYDVMNIEKGTYSDGDIFRIGYIGRLSPRKHVERLIYALFELKKSISNIELVIIGADVKKYENYLKRLSIKLGLEDSLFFSGFLKKEAKDKAIRRCSVFAFPSDFENWGNVVPDVLVREIPAIATKGMPWSILEEEKCGWWIDNTQEELNKALMEAYHTPFEDRRAMGIKGRQIVEQRYNTQIVAKSLQALYRWILKGGEKPDFVYSVEE